MTTRPPPSRAGERRPAGRKPDLAALRGLADYYARHGPDRGVPVGHEGLRWLLDRAEAVAGLLDVVDNGWTPGTFPDPEVEAVAEGINELRVVLADALRVVAKINGEAP